MIADPQGAPGADPGPALPLRGVRVLDLSRFLAGPMAAHLLAEMGAEVIKVEPPGGDPSRRGSGLAPGAPPNAQFLAVHRNKQGMTLNLKTAAGRALLRELAGVSDVLVENFRPGAAAAMGAGPDDLRPANPRLIYCSISGYGAHGPESELPAVDGTIQAAAGLLTLRPREDPASAGGGQTVWPVHIADVASALFAVQAVVAALYDRSRTGRGSWIDVSMVESLLQLMPIQVQTLLAGMAPPALMDPDHDRVTVLDLECRDGERILVQLPLADAAERFRLLVARETGGEDLLATRFTTEAGRSAAAGEYVGLVRTAFRSLDRGEWSRRLRAAGILCGPVNTLAEALASPQLGVRGAFRQTRAGAGEVPVLAAPYRFDGRRRPGPDSPPPHLGQDTGDILRRLLGHDSRKLADLAAAGAF